MKYSPDLLISDFQRIEENKNPIGNAAKKEERELWKNIYLITKFVLKIAETIAFQIFFLKIFMKNIVNAEELKEMERIESHPKEWWKK